LPDQRKYEIPTIISESPNTSLVPAEFAEYRQSRIRDFAPPFRVSAGELEITYVPYGIVLPGEQINQAKRPNLHGYSPSELLEQFKSAHMHLFVPKLMG
jgi:hypothetical protein